MVNTMANTLRRTASGASGSMGQACKTANDAATGVGKTVASGEGVANKANSMGQGARNVIAGMSGGQGK